MASLLTPIVREDKARFAFNGREKLGLQQLEFEQRMRYERRYAADPKGFHARLVVKGYWYVAAQLKVDHAVGRLL